MTEKKKAARARYTLEFKQEEVRLVESGQSMAAAARDMGMAEQTLFHGVKAQRQGRLSGSPAAECPAPNRGRSVAGEPSWHASRGSATSWEKRPRTSPKAGSEVRLYSTAPAAVAHSCAMPRAGCQRGRILRIPANVN